MDIMQMDIECVTPNEKVKMLQLQAYDDGYNGGYEKGKEETKHKIVTMLNAYCESLEAEDVKWRKPYVLGIRHSIELIEEIYG